MCAAECEIKINELSEQINRLVKEKEDCIVQRRNITNKEKISDAEIIEADVMMERIYALREQLADLIDEKFNLEHWRASVNQAFCIAYLQKK